MHACEGVCLRLFSLGKSKEEGRVTRMQQLRESFVICIGIGLVVSLILSGCGGGGEIYVVDDGRQPVPRPGAQ